MRLPWQDVRCFRARHVCRGGYPSPNALRDFSRLAAVLYQISRPRKSASEKSHSLRADSIPTQVARVSPYLLFFHSDFDLT